MGIHSKKTPKKDPSSNSSKRSSGKPTVSFPDTQPHSLVQKKMQELADYSPQASQLKSVQEMADKNEKKQPKENNTGLPDNLKAGAENLSGHSLDDVKVHYNSPEPAQLQAHAYAQGTEIHIGPGQEKHLPHEAWHVVQQKQGRVEPTKQLKEETNINDDAGLEKEADVMGEKANSLLQKQAFPDQPETLTIHSPGKKAPIQAVMSVDAFKQLTTLGENRKTIASIDQALQEYHDFMLQPVDLDDQQANTLERTRLIQLVLQRTDTYIQTKEQSDPNHKRLEPVRRFREDVLMEIEQINGNIPSNPNIDGQIDQDPDSDDTRSLILSISKAPSARQLVRNYLQATNTQQKITTMTTLYSRGHLPLIFDPAFINGAGSDLIADFPKGKALSSTPRKIINLFVEMTTDLGALKKLVSQRFDIDVANIKGLEVGKPTAGDDTVQAETDWTVDGLKRAYNIMVKLPDGHAISNTSFAKLKRFTGGGGWYGDTNTVSIAYDNINDKKGDERTLSDKLNGRGTNVFTGKNSFDKTVRHEVGHAVDHQHNFSGAYCTTANGGGWTSFATSMNMVNDYLAQNNSALSNHPACLGLVKLEIAKLITAEETVDNVKNEVINLMTQTSNNHGIAFNADIVRNDSIFVDLQKVNLQKPWKTSGGKDVGGKTYVYSNDTSLASYDTAARARQVSNYQFRAPGEWFAEAYAAYYQPDQTQRGYGSVLQGRDATTYNYIETNVDIIL